jgi:hypothetical protein
MTELTIPFDKNDVRYDAARKEVSLSVQKFDALVHFIQALLQRIESAEDLEGVLRYRLNEFDAENSLLQSVFQKVRKDVSAWLGSEHTIRELANRTGIPYATCYRIVKDRLEKGESVDTGNLVKIEAVVSEDLKKIRAGIGDYVVLLPRPGESETAGEAQSQWNEKSRSAGAGMTEKEVTKKLKEGKLVVKLFDISTGKTQPVEVKDFNLQPAKRAGFGLYNLKVKLAAPTAVKQRAVFQRNFGKSKS